MLKPYQGNEPYIFISYAHKDDAVVLKVIEALQSNGLRVWYDNGIKVGTEWPKFIAGRIKSCKRFIAFMSSNYEASKNCRREFNFADKYDVKTLVVFLEDFEVKDEGMDMQISLNQCMFRSKFALDSEFVGELSNAEILQCCKGNEITGDISPEGTTDSTKLKKISNFVYVKKTKTKNISRPVYVESMEGKNGEFNYTYTGYTLDGKRHGHGKIIWSDGEVYEGDWQNGNRHGQGKCIYSDGAVYEGEWRDDEFHGQGKYTWPDGEVYEGQFADGKYSGYGKCIYADGDIYEGEWLNDNYHGQGKFIYSDGVVYEGAWQKGQRHGRGILSYPNGISYESGWVNDMQISQGVIRYPNGDVYDGQWSDEMPNGQGTYTYANGKVVKGNWRNGKKVLF